MAAKKKAKSRKKAAKKRVNRKKKPVKKRGFFVRLLLLPFTIVNRITDFFPTLLRWPLRLCGYLGVIGLVCFLILASFYGARAMKYDMAHVAIMPERSVILDKNGKEIGRLHGEKRDIITLDQVSPIFQKAILAREDARFYKHGAVDPRGVARMIFQNIKRKSLAQGASTLSMQLARNSFKLGGKNIDRKFLEIAVAYRIENNYSKDEILQHYVNRIFWGHSIQGIEEASRTYFEKHASQLTLSDAAMLAGIVRGPNAFSPFKDIKKAERERNTTLASMVRHDFITQAEADKAKAQPLAIRPQKRRMFQNSYALDVIRNELEIILDDLILSSKNFTTGGLKIHTTLDLDLQNLSQKALNKHLSEIENRSGYQHQTRRSYQNAGRKGEPAYIQGAVVTIENHTGAIRSIIGGRDVAESQYNRATQARRQIGSLFKPFIYLAAFDKGLKPETNIDDSRIPKGEIRNAPKWSPRNSDGKYKGLKPASYGLIHSRNTMTVRIADYVGIDGVIETAKQVGLHTNNHPVPRNPSSYLGSWEATPLDIASAYTIFPNNGSRYPPRLINRITNNAGQVLYDPKPQSYHATNIGPTWATSQVLRQVTRSGTASRVRRMNFKVDSAGKTGTTDDFKDAWFAGYTSQLTTAVWVGMDSPKRTINGGYGSTLAVPIWVEVMKGAARLGYRADSLATQMPSRKCELCRMSGRFATSGCRAARTAYTTTLPTSLAPQANEYCPIHPIKAQAVQPQQHRRRPSPPPRAIPAQPVRPTRAIPAEPVRQAPRAIPAAPVR